MKSLRVVLVVAMFSLFSFAAQAQNVGQAVAGLLNVVAAIQVGDINIEDVQVVNVEDVDVDISDIDISILENVSVRNVRINALNNLLRDADIDLLNESQVVIGVLSSGEIIYSTL